MHPAFLRPTAQLRRLPRAHAPSLVRLAERAGRLRCPFWRRRAGDALDALGHVLGWAAARHASLPIPARAGAAPFGPALAPAERLRRIRADFDVRQYYVTGRLSRELYAPDCVFDGPDPDTPVRGTKKWVSATAGLFDHSQSRIDLLGIRAVGGNKVYAEWRLEGVLNLPWKPPIKPYQGTTMYTFNDQGLICDHFETWSISAVDAFVSVVWPSFGKPPAPPAFQLRAEKDAISEKE